MIINKLYNISVPRIADNLRGQIILAKTRFDKIINAKSIENVYRAIL